MNKKRTSKIPSDIILLKCHEYVAEYFFFIETLRLQLFGFTLMIINVM